MIRLFLLLTALLFFGLQGNAFAQAAEIPQEDVDALSHIAHDAMAKMKISNGELIGEEKAKTLVYPLIPMDLIKFVIVRGHVAGFAAHCGLDWENKFYAPMMGFLRGREKAYNEYQWAYVGALHGVSMNNAESAVKDKPCDPEMKEQLMKAAK